MDLPIDDLALLVLADAMGDEEQMLRVEVDLGPLSPVAAVLDRELVESSVACSSVSSSLVGSTTSIQTRWSASRASSIVRRFERLLFSVPSW